MTLYEAIYRDLYEKITGGFYEIGDMLPTENELEEFYDVSKSPIRHAVSKLAEQGLVEKRPGRGTYVIRVSPIDYNATLSGFTSDLMDFKSQIYAKTIDVSIVTAEDTVARMLKVDPGTSVLLTRRIRYLEDEPVYYLKHYITRTDLYETIKHMQEIESFRAMMIEKFNFQMDLVKESLEAVLPDEEVGQMLGLTQAVPLIHVERVTFNPKGQPLEYDDYYVRTEHLRYKVMFRRNLIPNIT